MNRKRKGRSLSFEAVEKASQSFFAAAKKINTIVFCGGVYVAENTSHGAECRIVRHVAENTSHGAECRIVRHRRTTEAWSEVQSLLSKKA